MILNIKAGIPFLGKKYNNPSPDKLQANLKTSAWGIPLTYRLITVHKIKVALKIFNYNLSLTLVSFSFRMREANNKHRNFLLSYTTAVML